MKYISTRGSSKALTFEQVLTSGLADDGGLYVPETIPTFTAEEISSWKNLPYTELVEKIITPFIDGGIPQDDLRAIIDESYSNFRHPEIAPLHRLENETYILELFHGPTLAFKDFALQLLGRLLDYVLDRKKQDVVVIGATSGDTGSAAIEGCLHCKHIKLFMLHPYGKVSDIQRRQMTTIDADNIHNIAIDGTFDDCQNMVKTLFRNPEFLEGRQLVAVNSINWARIMAQIVYYFSSALSLGAPEKSIAYAVPTGNFGDIYAGYIASKMGLPIKQLIIATNRNNILHRFLSDNNYSMGETFQTHSPSMDIQISSNLERLIYDLYDGDGSAVAELMDSFTNTAKMEIGEEQLAKARELFSSEQCNDETTRSVIKNTFNKHGYHLDPHTATAIHAAQEKRADENIPMVVMATAHPAKFSDVAIKTIGKAAELPEHLSDLMERKESYTHLPGDLEKVKQYIQENL